MWLGCKCVKLLLLSAGALEEDMVQVQAVEPLLVDDGGAVIVGSKNTGLLRTVVGWKTKQIVGGLRLIDWGIVA